MAGVIHPNSARSTLSRRPGKCEGPKHADPYTPRSRRGPNSLHTPLFQMHKTNSRLEHVGPPPRPAAPSLFYAVLIRSAFYATVAACADAPLTRAEPTRRRNGGAPGSSAPGAESRWVNLDRVGAAGAVALPRTLVGGAGTRLPQNPRSACARGPCSWVSELEAGVGEGREEAEAHFGSWNLACTPVFAPPRRPERTLGGA